MNEWSISLECKIFQYAGISIVNDFIKRTTNFNICTVVGPFRLVGCDGAWTDLVFLWVALICVHSNAAARTADLFFPSSRILRELSDSMPLISVMWLSDRLRNTSCCRCERCWIRVIRLCWRLSSCSPPKAASWGHSCRRCLRNGVGRFDSGQEIME